MGTTDRQQLSKAACSEVLQWMDEAIAAAASTKDDIPVGCLVVLDGKELARACNVRESSCDPAGHAEIVALRQAAHKLGRWRLNGATVYTTLEPCPMCAEALIQSRVSQVVFGAYDPASGAAGSAFNLFVAGRIFPIPEVIGGIREEECKRLIVEFFKSKGQLR